MKDYLIIADGDFLAKEIILEAAQDKTILALDAAADNLMSMGIVPHIILGDFDADSESHAAFWGIQKTFSQLTDEDETPYLGLHGVTIVPRKNQNLTDLVKAIIYCDQQNATSITIVCATGGRLDHHETAMRVLRSAYQKDRLILLHTDQQTVRFAKDETICVEGNIGDKCGFFAFPQAVFSSQGLVYEASHYPLNFAFSESVGNMLKVPRAKVEVQGEALVIMPAQLAAQRVFIRKSRKERLLTLLRDNN